MPNTPITIGTIVTFMFHSFFNSLARSRYLSFFYLSFRFILWSAGTAKSTILQILFFFFLLIVMRSGLLTGIRWSVCILKSHKSLWEIVIIIIIITYSFRVFQISVSWWFFSGVWVTASLPKSPGLFPVFWPFSIMLWFRWSPLVRQLPYTLGPLIIIQLLCQKHQSQLVQSSLSCSIVFQFSNKVEELILLFTFFQFYSMFSRESKVDTFASSLFFFFFCWLL